MDKEYTFIYELDNINNNIKVNVLYKRINGIRMRYEIDDVLVVHMNERISKAQLLEIISKNKNWILSQQKRNASLFSEFDIKSLLEKNKVLFMGKVMDKGEVSLDKLSNYKNFFQKHEKILIELYEKLTKDYQNPPKLKIKALKSKWGSYKKSTNEITLNLYLLFFSIDLINYVIYHELTHIKVFSHNKNFYLELKKVCPNYKELQKSLKKMSIITKKLVA